MLNSFARNVISRVPITIAIMMHGFRYVSRSVAAAERFGAEHVLLAWA